MKHLLVFLSTLALCANAATFKEIEAKAKTHHFTFSVKNTFQLTHRATGFRPDLAPKHKLTYTTITPDAHLPSHFDWREQGDGLTPIKNQGQCGSCWAFGTVAVLEQLVKLREGKTLDLSEQQLVSCNPWGYSCMGGYFAHDYHVNPGATDSEHFPYVAADTACKDSLPIVAKLAKWSFVGGSDQKAPKTEDVKTALKKYGPLATGVYVSDSLAAYNSGVFNDCEEGQLNHMVNLVGWDDKGKYWIVRNSWGAEWGEKGYFRIKYGCNGIGSIASFAEIPEGTLKAKKK